MRGMTMFSGGGGVETLLKDDIDFVAAIEYDAAIADVYRANIGDHVIVDDVCDVDYTQFGRIDYLHASPVCKNASQAKTNGTESDIDIQTAEAVGRALRTLQPRIFTLENVGGYQRFDAYRRICRTLDALGYMWHAEVLNAADYGVPQTRRRLILRAVKDALLPGLPQPQPWVGWHAAIEDLIPTLPASQFAPWQLARLPLDIKQSFITDTMNTTRDATTRLSDMPIMTIQAAHGWRPSQMPNAFLMPNTTESDVRNRAEPSHTVTSSDYKNMRRAFLVGEDSKMGIVSAEQPSMPVVSSPRSSSARAWLSQGRVVKMTPRALARFQSLPDWYALPERNSLACTVIGNMVPPLLMREVVMPLL